MKILLPMIAVLLGVVLVSSSLRRKSQKGIYRAIQTLRDKEQESKDIYLDPAPVKATFLEKTPQCRADACADFRINSCRYPITLPYVEYDCKYTIPDDAPCTEFLQAP